VAVRVYWGGHHPCGMQAKASGTASPLGDFLDHFCDLWAGCILVFGFWTLLDTASRGVLFGLQALLILGFAVTYAERELRQALHFTRYGTLEAIVIVTVFALSWMVPEARDWWRAELVAGVPVYGLIVGLGALMGVVAVGVIVRRLGTLPAPVALFATGVTALSVLFTNRPDIQPIVGWLVLAAYGARYIARVMHGSLTAGARSWPDRIATASALLLAGWTLLARPSAGDLRLALLLFAAYVLLTLTAALYQIIFSLRQHWVWVNASRRAAP